MIAAPRVAVPIRFLMAVAESDEAVSAAHVIRWLRTLVLQWRRGFRVSGLRVGTAA